VKRLKDFSLAGEDLKQFEKEVTILIRIPPHPAVVGFKGVAKTTNALLGETYCLVLEFCEGGSLKDYLKSNAKINERQNLEFIQRICEGLSHLHKYGIIHRDVAARNVLLSKDLKPKISDFGMARALNKETSMAVTGQAIGALKWMAPESIRSQQYSTRSDSWMLGVLIIEILSRKEPWEGKGSQEVGAEVVSKKIHHPIPSQANPEMSKLLEELFSFEPKQRPETHEVIVIIQKMLQHTK